MRECSSLNWLSQVSQREMLLWHEILINMARCSSWKHDPNQCHLQVNGRWPEAEASQEVLLLCHARPLLSCLCNDIISLYLNGQHEGSNTRRQEQQFKAATVAGRLHDCGSWGRQMPPIIFLSESTGGTGDWLVPCSRSQGYKRCCSSAA